MENKLVGKTNNNLMRKEIIGVDIDNTIAATDKQIRSLIKRFYNLAATEKEIKTWYYSDSLRITPEQEMFVFDQFHNHYLLEVEMIPGAKRALKILSEYYNIWLLTSRPPYTESQTKAWLKIKSIPYDQLYFLKQKSVLLSEINFLIEDKAETALEFASKGTRVFLLDYPWNKAVSHSLISRINTWSQILQFFSTMT